MLKSLERALYLRARLFEDISSLDLHSPISERSYTNLDRGDGAMDVERISRDSAGEGIGDGIGEDAGERSWKFWLVEAPVMILGCTFRCCFAGSVEKPKED